MNETIRFIEYLLEKTKDFKDGIFIPNEIELKISELDNINPIILQRLSELEQVILTRSNHINDDVIRKEEYRVRLINYSLDNDSISFYPIALKNYLKKIKQ